MLELSELDVSFGAPRHLLCGKVDAKMTYTKLQSCSESDIQLA